MAPPTKTDRPTSLHTAHIRFGRKIIIFQPKIANWSIYFWFKMGLFGFSAIEHLCAHFTHTHTHNHTEKQTQPHRARFQKQNQVYRCVTANCSSQKYHSLKCHNKNGIRLSFFGPFLNDDDDDGTLCGVSSGGGGGGDSVSDGDERITCKSTS